MVKPKFYSTLVAGIITLGISASASAETNQTVQNEKMPVLNLENAIGAAYTFSPRGKIPDLIFLVNFDVDGDQIEDRIAAYIVCNEDYRDSFLAYLDTGNLYFNLEGAKGMVKDIKPYAIAIFDKKIIKVDNNPRDGYVDATLQTGKRPKAPECSFD